MAPPPPAQATRSHAAEAKPKPPVEYSILYTATLCLLAVGAVMVYSASSAESLPRSGDAAYYLKRYVVLGRGRPGRAAPHLAARPAPAEGAHAAAWSSAASC